MIVTGSERVAALLAAIDAAILEHSCDGDGGCGFCILGVKIQEELKAIRSRP